jgi:hypothetical protein
VWLPRAVTCGLPPKRRKTIICRADGRDRPFGGAPYRALYARAGYCPSTRAMFVVVSADAGVEDVGYGLSGRPREPVTGRFRQGDRPLVASTASSAPARLLRSGSATAATCSPLAGTACVTVEPKPGDWFRRLPASLVAVFMLLRAAVTARTAALIEILVWEFCSVGR